MFSKLRKRILKTYRAVRGSIATYPALLSISLAIAAGVLLSIETPELTQTLRRTAGLLILNNADTARALLSTLIGGVISLTVFSFSMVMILLNQASNNYSPRLLPGLISNKQHQFVLGFYIGTILFNIICLINILPDERDVQIPGFTVLIAILLGLVCLVLFVFFIHSISQSIQINHILRRLYRETSSTLEQLTERMKRHLPSKDPDERTHKWFPIKSRQYGHLMSISESGLVELAREQQIIFRISHPRGMTVLRGEPVLYASKQQGEDIENKVLDFLHFGDQELVEENFLFGIKQLTEILVKAMSPGINDPGTAMDALDYLTALIAKRMQTGDYFSVLDEAEAPRLYLQIIPFEDLVYHCFAAIRTYIAHDPLLVQRMLAAMEHLKQMEGASSNQMRTLEREKEALWEDVRRHIKNEHDLARIRQFVHPD